MIELRKHTMLEIPEMGWYDPDVVDARIASLFSCVLILSPPPAPSDDVFMSMSLLLCPA